MIAVDSWWLAVTMRYQEMVTAAYSMKHGGNLRADILRLTTRGPVLVTK